MFRVDTGCCLYFDYEENKFCQNPSVNNSARCAVHQDTANSKFMKILAKLNNNEKTVGFSLCSAAYRFFNEPKIISEFVEYAPSLEGSVPAFKHSTNNLRKLLIAGYSSFKAGYLTKSTIPFRENFFVDQFPQAKNITRKYWMHSYLSLWVSLSYYLTKLLVNMIAEF